MGLFRALIVILVGSFVTTLIENPKSKLNNLPVVGDLFTPKIKKYKCMILILSIALVDLLL
jgi:hypothetical protein